MIIKHERFLDLAIMITKPLIRLKDGSVIIRGHYINQGFNKSYDLNINVKLRINKDDKSKWLVCNTPLDMCVRYSTWRPFDRRL